MYEYLEGVVQQRAPTHVVLDVGGLGFHVQIPPRIETDLPREGERLRIYVHMQVSEGEAPRLYGFTSPFERGVFRLIIGVSKLGPAAGLALLNTFDGGQLVGCVIEGRADQLVRAKGIGKKTAERVILELKESFEKLARDAGFEALPQASEKEHDLLRVLVGLGYTSKESQRIVRAKVQENPEADLETLLRLVVEAH